MKEELKYIYDDIYRWLIFAEAKNISFLAVIGFLFDKLLGTESAALTYNEMIRYILIVLLGIVTLILIISFFPFLNKNSFVCAYVYKTYKKMISSDNMILYLNIFLTDYYYNENKNRPGAVSVEQKIGVSDINSLSKFEQSLVNQIKENARVTSIKYALFSLAIKIFYVVMVVLGFSMFVCA